MSDADDAEYRGVLLTLLRRHGSLTANRCARETHRKHETAKRMLTMMVDDGLVYTKNYGKTVYYVLMPNPRTEPAPKKKGKEGKTEDDVYVRATSMVSFVRADHRLEIIPRPGFVCHPSMKGSNLDNEWIRAHHNGEYQVRIRDVGSMKTTDYFADTDIRVKWDKTGLNTNVQCLGKVFLHDDTRPFNLRTVSNKDGSFTTLSIKVHPRYVYYVASNETAELEFRQQVIDVLDVLERGGWVFDRSTIKRIGKIHRAGNDPVLGSQVGDYHEQDGDEIHYDHSHGTPEWEIYGNDNPADIEIMVKLPTIIRSFGESLIEIQRNMALMLDIQSKTVQLMTPVKADTPSPSSMIFHGDVGYGKL